MVMALGLNHDHDTAQLVIILLSSCITLKLLKVGLAQLCHDTTPGLGIT